VGVKTVKIIPQPGAGMFIFSTRSGQLKTMSGILFWMIGEKY
jgi:hypothetical protein